MSERLGVGQKFPDSVMTAPDGSDVKASDFAGKKLVVFFYPKDDTPGCTTENKDFSALYDEFLTHDIAVIGVSKDPPKKHAKFTEKHGLTAPLVSDAEAGGVSDALGIWTEKSMYGKTYMGMERTTYLIDKTGIISKIWNKVKVKGHADEVLVSAKEL